MSDFVPVFSAIAGGLLTALGTALLQRSARAGERREFLRARLEQLYTLSSQLIRWGDQQVSTAAMLGLAVSGSAQEAKGGMAAQENVNRPTDDILMLARFYHPRLAQAAEDLDEKATHVVDSVNEFMSYIGSKPHSDPVDPDRLNSASQARDELEAAARRYQVALATGARKLV